MGVREKDYDAAAAAKEQIRVKVGATVYEYGPEAPLDVAIEWLDRQTQTAKDLNESNAEYMMANYRLVIGRKNFEEMLEHRAGSKTIDDLYRDLLDWWGVWPRPKEMSSDLDLALNRLDALGSRLVEQEDRLAHAGLVAEVRETVQTMEEKLGDEAEQLEEEEAGNPA